MLAGNHVCFWLDVFNLLIWYNANSCTWLASFATYFVKFILHQFCKFHPSLHESVTCYSHPKVKTNSRFPYILLREKCPNMEFFLVRIFPYSDRIRRDTPYLYSKCGKVRTRKTPYLNTFNAVMKNIS